MKARATMMGPRIGSIPHPVLGNTRGHCRYITARGTPYQGANTIEGTDLSHAPIVQFEGYKPL